MNYIEELYFGNINPNEKRFYGNRQYVEALHRFCENEKILNKMLANVDLEVFNRLVNAHNELISCTETENFKRGFILAVHIMAECFNCEFDCE